MISENKIRQRMFSTPKNYERLSYQLPFGGRQRISEDFVHSKLAVFTY